MSCLQDNVSVGMKRVKLKCSFKIHRSSAVHGRCREICCYNYHAHILDLEGDDLILLLDVLHYTNEVVTVAEAAETVEVTETAANEVQHERI